LLKSDLLFQENLKNYTEASALLTVYLSKWGNNHPQVVKERARQKATHEAMLKRSSVLLGRSNVQHLNLNNSEKRAQLFQNLLSLYAEQQGLAAKAKELAALINKFENRLNAQLVMEVALIMGHLNWELGTGKLIKSSVGWAKGWALIAIFPFFWFPRACVGTQFRRASVTAMRRRHPDGCPRRRVSTRLIRWIRGAISTLHVNAIKIILPNSDLLVVDNYMT
jgi:hypothetical protein